MGQMHGGVANDERRRDLHDQQRAPGRRGSRGCRRGRGGEADGPQRKDLHDGFADGGGNDLVEGLAVAEVGALVLGREERRARAALARQHTALPPELHPEGLVGGTVHGVRHDLERRQLRWRRTSEPLLESHHLLAQLVTHLLDGEDAPDEQVIPDRVGEQEQRQRRAGDQPGGHPAIGTSEIPFHYPFFPDAAKRYPRYQKRARILLDRPLEPIACDRRLNPRAGHEPEV